jgi:hypothetical protein
MLTKAFRWVETRLEEGAWFRRLYVLWASILTAQVTFWSMRFAETSSKPGLEIAAIVTAVAAVPGAVVGFAFTQYLNARTK